MAPPAYTPHSLTGQSAWQDLLRLLKETTASEIRGKPTLRGRDSRGYWYDRFRQGGTVVGTHAFRQYEGVLGVRIRADQAAQTNDIDIASFERLSLALRDQVDPSLAQVFGSLDFEPQPALGDRKVWRWRQTR